MNEENVAVETENLLDTPEIEAVETTTETSDAQAEAETPEQRAERAEKKAFALEKRVGRLVGEKYHLRDELGRISGKVQEMDEKLSSVTKPMPQRSDFASDDDYIDFRAKQVAEERVGDVMRNFDDQRRQEAQRKETEALAKTFTKQVEAVSAKYIDYDKVVENSADIFTQVSPLAERALLESPFGAEISYLIAKNDEEAEEFIAMTPAQQVKFIGKQEAKLETRPIKTRSSAPEPIPTIGGRSSGNGEPKDSNSEEWIAWRNKQKS
jgi:hypothetical protein